jgi:methyl-accepting chemotaxis protein
MQFILIVLAASLLLSNILPEPYDIIITSIVLLAAAAAVTVKSNAREKQQLDHIAGLSKELSVASSRIGSVSQEIGVTLAENNDCSQALFRQTQNMRHHTADVSDCLGHTILSIKSMITNAEETRTTALTMADTSRAAFDTIQRSNSEILGIVDTMSKIKDTSGRAASSIEKLRTASGDVRTIVDQISGISKQMHIIAVNASVEAVRAGSGGSSFTVVAREFQNLSAMTDSAAKSIDSLVDVIQTGILEVYTAVTANDSRVDEGVRFSKAVELNLNKINESFSDVIAMVDRIGSISEAEARLADDMGQGIDRIETLIAETVENVGLVYQSALTQRKGNQNISEMGARLRSASEELNGLNESSFQTPAETLDKQTHAECASFFPVIHNLLCNHPDITVIDPEVHAALLGRFKSAYPIVEAVWTNDRNGRFICSIPKAGIANAAMRDWFKAGISGESYISSIYISGITKNKCVTLSVPFHNDQSDIIGVVGVDLTLDMLQHKTRTR